jgi:histidine triad (HIT) family protein
MSSPVSRSLFDRIIAGEIPCDKVYEDDTAFAFRDIHPTAPVHVLVVPKVMGRLSSLSNSSADDRATLGHLMWAAAEVARREGISGTGYRVVVNDGSNGGQTVPHLHLHVIGGKQLSWPPGCGTPERTKA